MPRMATSNSGCVSTTSVAECNRDALMFELACLLWRSSGFRSAIHLAPGQDMSPEQIKLLWGSTKPSLKNTLYFLACAGTQHSIVGGERQIL